MAEETSAAEARRRRLRWITLGEALGVAALVVSVLTLWNNYSERRHNEDEKAAQDRASSTKARILVLRAEVEKKGDRLALQPTGEQVIQGQTIAFPKALGIDPVDSTDPRIEADWLSDGLRKARRDAGEDERPRGDARLPVAITTRFTVGGDVAEDVTLYDVGYAIEGGFLGDSEVRLRGLSMIGRTTASAAQKQLDEIWASRHRKKG
ncbi:MAG: hypothetical protein ACOY5R_07230 [Pseudomonadota bacterium]